MNADEVRKLVHDLRTPLTVVQGFARMLERGEGSLSTDERAEFLARILEASKEMSDILDDVRRRAAS